ncbi:MAG: hypothetical protein M2R45_03900 [Verrucomicrobia subdivision 3 bacterium]|nr:hypothetical protein [Limisphaerales bacterium]MCS1412603.1 hypothetical protein [Limisphaerales bacterium]
MAASLSNACGGVSAAASGWRRFGFTSDSGSGEPVPLLAIRLLLVPSDALTVSLQFVLLPFETPLPFIELLDFLTVLLAELMVLKAPANDEDDEKGVQSHANPSVKSSVL